MRIDRLQRDLFKQLLSELDKAGVNPDQLFVRSGLQGMDASAARQRVFAGIESLVLLETAVKLTGDTGLAIRLGQQIGITSYGTFGFALISCANLREAIELLGRYGKVFFEPSWESHEQDGGLMLRIHLNLGSQVQQQLLTELCILCRHRHKMHYANFLIMPTFRLKSASPAAIVVMESA